MIELNLESGGDGTARQRNKMKNIINKSQLDEDDYLSVQTLIETMLGEEITLIQARNYIDSIRFNNTIRSKIFSPTKGVIAGFNIGSKRVDQTSFGNKQVAVGNVIQKLQDEEHGSIGASVETMENGSNLTLLNEGIKNQPFASDTKKPFNDEEIILIKRMKVVLTVEPDINVNLSYEKHKEIQSLLTVFDHIPANQRADYYNYWRGVSKTYKDLALVINTLNREITEDWINSPAITITDTSQEEIKEVEEEETEEMARFKEKFRSTKVPVKESREEAQKRENKNLKHKFGEKTEKKQKMEKLTLPNYVIELDAMTVASQEDKWKIGKLVNAYLTQVDGFVKSGKYKKYDKIDAGRASTGRVDQAFNEREEGLDVSARVSVDFDKEKEEEYSTEEYETESGEQKKNFRELEKEMLDPLFALNTVIEGAKLEVNYTQNILDGAKEELMAMLNTGEGGIAKVVYEVMSESIDKFIDDYSKIGNVPPIDGVYYLPILDDERHVKAFDDLLSGSAGNYLVTVEVLGDTGVTTPRQFNKYSDAVDFVNTHTNKFFEILTKYKKVKQSRVGILSTGRGHGGRPDKGGYFGGSERLTKPGKLAESDKKISEGLTELDKILDDYYLIPLTANRYLYNRDRPLFYSSGPFKSYTEISSGDPVQLVINSIIEEGDITNLTGNSLDNIIQAIKEIGKGNQQRYTHELGTKYDNVVSSFVTIFSALPKEDTVKIMNAIKVAFGDMLYEVAKNRYWNTDRKKLESLTWKRKPLTYWDSQEKKTLTDVPYIADLLLRREWLDMISRLSQTDDTIYKKNKQLSELIWKASSDLKLTSMTNAMLYTKDLLLKMKGEPQYIATMDLYDVDDISFVVDLIQKEDRIDIYATDIEKIVKQQGAFNSVADSMGIDEHIVYKIKGMFRGE